MAEFELFDWTCLASFFSMTDLSSHMFGFHFFNDWFEFSSLMKVPLSMPPSQSTTLNANPGHTIREREK